MTFTKTSQKFGQWIDFKLNFVYGLGFPNDAELNKFVEKFKEIKDLTRNNNKTHERSNSCEIPSTVIRPQIQSSDSQDKSETTIKYENERLKLALNHATSISKKYEEEIQSLTSNNIYLNQVLRENIKNPEELRKKNFIEESSIKSDFNNVEINNNNKFVNHQIDEASIQSKSDDFSSRKESKNFKSLKNELVKQSLNFEKKLAELYEINEKIKSILNDLDIK